MRTPSYTKAATAATLNICHCVTADMDDGQALPPFIDDNVVWHVVRRADGRSLAMFTPMRHSATEIVETYGRAALAAVLQGPSGIFGPWLYPDDI